MRPTRWPARDIASFVYDQRGHGMSPGTRTHVGSFTDFAADLKLIGENVRQRFPALPLFVWGHSMGSVVVLLAAPELPWARGIITTGCALDALPKLEGIPGAVLRMASALAPRLRISLRIDATALTQVAEEQSRHMSDPLVPRTASLRLLYGFAQACRTGRANAAKIMLPWLAVHGEADKVCPISGSRALIDTLGSTRQAAGDAIPTSFTRSTTKTRPRARCYSISCRTGCSSEPRSLSGHSALEYTAIRVC